MSNKLFETIYSPEDHIANCVGMEISAIAESSAKKLFEEFTGYDPLEIAGLMGSIFWTAACRQVIKKRREVFGDPFAEIKRLTQPKACKWGKCNGSVPPQGGKCSRCGDIT